MSEQLNERGLRGAVVSASLLASLAAVVGYGAHHASPLSEHTAITVLLAVAASVVVALVLLLVESGRRHAALAPVVVAAPGTVGVRPAEGSDAAFCAALHAEALPHGFFVSLGPRFLRAYYRTFLDSPHAIALVAVAAEHPVGMVVGITAPRAHRRLVLRKHGPRLALAGLAALVTRPLVGLRFARTRLARYLRAWRRDRGEPEGQAPERADTPRAAVLSHIAVTPGARGAGIGALLLERFEAAAREAGAGRIVLVTLEGEGGAGPFYAAHGWTSGPAHPTPDAETMREWTLDL